MNLTSFLIDDTLLIDAGALHSALTVEEQEKIDAIFISHIHMDHIVGLPFFFDTIYGVHDKPLKIYSMAETIEHLKKNLFNNQLWPDFSVLPTPENPTVEYVEIESEEILHINGLEIMPVLVNHIVPTTGFLIKENNKVWVYSSDTSDTDRIWELANDFGDIEMIFLECSFPNRKAELAESSRHLTAKGVARQLAKLTQQAPVRTYHYKPAHYDEIEAELKEIACKDLHQLKQGDIYKL